MQQLTTTVLSNVAHRGDYRRLTLAAGPMVADIRPGQFIHLRIPRLANNVLRRPFSVFRAANNELTLLYKVIGIGTQALCDVRTGEEVNILGPLGNGFPLELNGALPVLVAGGYGVAPLCMLAERLETPGVLFTGGATEADILCQDDFAKLGWETHTATMDGSLGAEGLVTVILDDWLAKRDAGQPVQFYACGPDGMLKAVGERAAGLDATAWLSLDKHMGCGVGACLACVQKLRNEDGSEHWGRVCRDGPVFESREIVW